MKKTIKYLGRIFADVNGNPSSKRYACALFAITGIALGACGYGVEITGLFVCAALGGNITTIFEKKD